VIPYPDFSNASVVVIGDIILDRYFWGQVHRISPEAPVPVVKVEKKTLNPGGAGNVAMNLKSLGCGHFLLGIAGDDANGAALAGILSQEAIHHMLLTLPNHPTTTKTRVIAQGQQVVRLDEESAPTIADTFRQQLITQFNKSLSKATGVILSDYGKGLVTPALAGHVIQQCRAKSIPLFVDPKGASWERYRGAFCVTPNTAEFNLIEPVPEGNEALLAEKAASVMHRFEFEYLLLTQGPKGMTLFHRQRPPVAIRTQAKAVFDVSGAGDTVIASLAAAFSAGVPLETAARIANIAAGIVIAKRGTQPAGMLELQHALWESGMENIGKIVTRQQAVEKIAAWRSTGKKIVFTNGCFDILHIGHIKLLHAAAAQGERLVIGLNSDRSVRQLKGNKRPIVAQDERAALLAAIKGVDLVVIFDEATPLDLIRRFQPDILVKGGDYTPETVVGHEIVEQAGGTVVIVPLVNGISTSHVINSIQKGIKNRS
jgi:D-beta-D-heptose 7-phosphate kinase/D-beta-D-heptose 1-phosphate adenosyltransferase